MKPFTVLHVVTSGGLTNPELEKGSFGYLELNMTGGGKYKLASVLLHGGHVVRTTWGVNSKW